MQIETVDHRAISEAEARAIAELLVAVWPKPGRTVATRTAEMLSQWQNYDGPENEYPRSFLIRENGRIVAHAQADPRTIHTTAGDLKVLALCRVCTDPEVRGRRLGQAVVEAAFDLVDNGVYPFALFQTREIVRPFYEKLGAAQVNNRFYNSKAADPNANPFWDPVAMRYPKTGIWPEGDIDTNGPGW
jgi:predicted N-acetyltransferase YhbS